MHSTRFNACREDQEARDALMPNCYKVVAVKLYLSHALYGVLHVGGAWLQHI